MRLRRCVCLLMCVSLASVLVCALLLTASSKTAQLQRQGYAHVIQTGPDSIRRQNSALQSSNSDIYAVLRALRYAILNTSNSKYFTVLKGGVPNFISESSNHRETKNMKQSNDFHGKKLLDMHRTPQTLIKPPSLANSRAKQSAVLSEATKQRIRAVRENSALMMECLKGKYCQIWSDQDDIWRHRSCFNNALALRKHGLEIRECHCQLLKAPHTTRTSLSSLPGSGNTWVRELLEAATGICTASMWCDPVLRGLKFCAEGVQGTATLVVKNHDPELRWRGDNSIDRRKKPEFDSAIFIHRDPYDATVAEWNRALAFEIANASWYDVTVEGVPDSVAREVSFNSHLTHFSKEFFGAHPGWSRMVHTQLDKWERMVTHLLVENTHPVLVVEYDSLRSNQLAEVERMLHFLSFPFDTDELRVKLEAGGFDSFRRMHDDKARRFEHFTSEQKVFVNSVIERVINKLSTSQVSHKFDLPLSEYIRR